MLEAPGWEGWELRVVAMLASGAGDEAIAEDLQVSVETAEAMILRLVLKAGACNRTNLVYLVYKQIRDGVELPGQEANNEGHSFSTPGDISRNRRRRLIRNRLGRSSLTLQEVINRLTITKTGL